MQLFPRGADSKPLDFDGPQRSASAFYYWASRNIPHNVKKIYHLEDLPAWIEEVRVSASACPARTHARAGEREPLSRFAVLPRFPANTDPPPFLIPPRLASPRRPAPCTYGP